MNFRIADTFTDSLGCLTGDEQKAVKTTAFDLQMNPASPGMSLHKLDKARGKSFWSIRVSRDIRLIVHKTQASLLLCYVDHHDKAYQWAERRKLETHPRTGAAQLVEIRERVEEIAVPRYVEVEQPVAPKPPLFTEVADGDLLAYGVPEEWLSDVRAANEDTLLELADHLPGEAAEALLELATGGKPAARGAPVHVVSPFEHPDAQRRFRTMNNVEELERALDFPWEKWTIFLHPAQREWVKKDFNGPARVSGSAGTGKTIVALHRAVYLARSNPEGRVLLATFSATLADALRIKLRRLIGSEPRLGERIEVGAMDAMGLRLYEAQSGSAHIASRDEILNVIEEASSQQPGHGFSRAFLLAEWEDVVDGWQLTSWDAYRDVQRLGRKTRLPESRRGVLWTIFEQVRSNLDSRGWLTYAGMFGRLTETLPQRRHPPFDFAVIDEAQDISVAQLRFLAALGANRPNALFFAGDLGQRIFQQPFSWASQGIEVRGRARTLKLNYRTSHQIRMQADRLLAPEVADVDGNVEQRRGTVSVFNGPKPTIEACSSNEAEVMAVAKWLQTCLEGNFLPHEIGVFVRSDTELDRAREALDSAGLPYKILGTSIATTPGYASISTMHQAKGLEFRAVAVMACDDEVIPSQQRMELVADDADLEEIYDTERHLLYVACTRARDRLHVSGVAPISEFLDDMDG